MKKIWIDILNPSHPLFFKPLIQELKNDYSFHITIRDRGETIKLSKEFGLTGEVIGRDYENPIKKMLSIVNRTLLLSYKVKSFDDAISIENPMSVAISKMKRKKSILFLDNDLKYKVKSNFFQDVESKIKLMADTIIIPDACEKTFYMHGPTEKFKSYNGYKEDFYIADYQPNPAILKKLPFENYVIIRGEALHSFYVNEKQSILPQLFNLLIKENVNILFLARDKSDFKYKENKNLSILKEPLNGLDLIYYSDAVLTGSGTMAREAACMDRTAVSFFPSNSLLSVDEQLVDDGKIFHSRDPKEIVEYVISHLKKNTTLDFRRSKLVKTQILRIVKSVISEN
jgi:predicted glycosyltransferase